ncbi:MAG: ATP-binding cassette domain-containing protein [Polyangiales bacterium]
MPLFEVRGLAKSFGPKTVLGGVDLTIERGEFFTLIGESGCGKSVLLKHLIGLLTPDRGEVFFDGENVTAKGDVAFAAVRRRVGMLFQNSALFDSMSVGDNVAYGLREQRLLPEDRIEERVAESLAHVQLPGIERMKPSDLSGGMRKRVALARAIAMRPEVVLYDEPTEGLDPINVTRVYRLLLSLKENLGISTIVVTHNMETAFHYSDRLAFMDKGVVTHVATPAEMRKERDPALAPFVHASVPAIQRG